MSRLLLLGTLLLCLAAPREVAAREPHKQTVRVEILWGGEWWPGTVVERRCGLTKVHYDEYDETWEEWVEQNRLRFSSLPAPAREPGR